MIDPGREGLDPVIDQDPVQPQDLRERNGLDLKLKKESVLLADTKEENPGTGLRRSPAIAAGTDPCLYRGELGSGTIEGDGRR